MNDTMCQVGEVASFGFQTKDVSHYIGGEWKRQIALSEPWFYDWQFKQSPDDAGKDHCAVVVSSDHEILGFMGLNKRRFYLNGTVCQAAELTTWMISEKIRGQGYAKKMLEYLKTRYDVLVGMGITAMALPVYLQLGFKFVRFIPRFVRIFNFDAVAPVSHISELGKKMIAKLSDAAPKTQARTRAVNINEIDPDLSSFHATYNGFSREKPYLKWRYVQHPVYGYQIFEVQSSHGSSIVVLRIEEKDGLRIVHVMDVIGPEEGLADVVGFLERFCRDESIDYADFYCTSTRISRFFWSGGWTSILNDSDIQVPHLLYPIEMRNPPTTSLIIWSRDSMISLLDESRLYITKEDCDLDRPTIQYLIEKGKQR